MCCERIGKWIYDLPSKYNRTIHFLSFICLTSPAEATGFYSHPTLCSLRDLKVVPWGKFFPLFCSSSIFCLIKLVCNFYGWTHYMLYQSKIADYVKGIFLVLRMLRMLWNNLDFIRNSEFDNVICN